jgi:hypothetical protein
MISREDLDWGLDRIESVLGPESQSSTESLVSAHA